MSFYSALGALFGIFIVHLSIFYYLPRCRNTLVGILIIMSGVMLIVAITAWGLTPSTYTSTNIGKAVTIIDDNTIIYQSGYNYDSPVIIGGGIIEVIIETDNNVEEAINITVNDVVVLSIDDVPIYKITEYKQIFGYLDYSISYYSLS